MSCAVVVKCRLKERQIASYRHRAESFASQNSSQLSWISFECFASKFARQTASGESLLSPCKVEIVKGIKTVKTVKLAQLSPAKT